MTLSFSTRWPEKMGEEYAGKPNHFVEKTLKSIPSEVTYFPVICEFCNWKGMSSLLDGCHPIADTGDFSDPLCPRCGSYNIEEWDGLELINNGYYLQSDFKPKKHTFREDPKNRWRVGMKIHPVINNRTEDRFQFVPVMEVKSIQNIEIIYDEEICNTHGVEPVIKIDGRAICDYVNRDDEYDRLALNDGFENVHQFLSWFDKDFTGKIIHWTDLKY